MPEGPIQRTEHELLDAEKRADRWAGRYPALNTFGTVVGLIIFDLLLIGFEGDTRIGSLLVIGTRAAILLLAVHISHVKARWGVLAATFVVLAMVIAGATILLGTSMATIVAGIVGVGLICVPPFVIARRLAQIVRQEGVVLEAVWAALSIYLLVGLVFSAVFQLVALISKTPFFVQVTNPPAIDYVYFSYVTMTTVGYGDLTALGSVGRMLAVSEALFGQIYLVTVVALIVSNFGRKRSQVLEEQRSAQKEGSSGEGERGTGARGEAAKDDAPG